MFKIDRNAGPQGTYIKTAGIYSGTIAFPKTIECTPKGDTKVSLQYTTEDGATASDDFINIEKMWWKLNVLLAAVDPDGTKIKVGDGHEVDLTKGQEFINLLKQFDGHTLKFAVWPETYQKHDGTQGTAYRVRPMDPRKTTAQLPPVARDAIKAAIAAAEGPDEIPF